MVAHQTAALVLSLASAYPIVVAAVLSAGFACVSGLLHLTSRTRCYRELLGAERTGWCSTAPERKKRTAIGQLLKEGAAEADVASSQILPNASLGAALGKDGWNTDMALQLQRTSSALFDIFPRSLAEAIRDGKRLEPQSSEEATVVFLDIVRFTEICADSQPMKVSDMLHRLFCSFDSLSTQFGVYKVETIGDAYVGVTNLVSEQRADHAKRAAQFGLAALRAAAEMLLDVEDERKGYISVRVGLDSGPVVGNVIGRRNLRFSLFGDTVNSASRMESASAAGHVLCTERAMKLLKEQAPEVPLFFHAELPIKGKGKMRTYWVHHAGPREAGA